MKFQIINFEGKYPAISPRLLSLSQAQIAENCDLRTGRLKPIKQPGDVVSVPAGTISVFPYNSRWLTWATDVNVVRNPIANDTYQRIHYTGDGVPKVRGIIGSTEYEYDLGVPKPTNTPTAVAIQKTSSSWTRNWHYYYEVYETGEITQEGDLEEGVLPTQIQEVIPGKSFKLDQKPARVTAAATDTFCMWFDAEDEYGADLGRLYPSISFYGGARGGNANSDLYIDGAYVTGEELNQSTTPNITFDLTFDTSRASDYKVERAYVYTFKTVFGEEGPPSEASTIVAVDPTQNCTVANFDTSVAGNYNITHIRLYRTVVDENGYSNYQYITEMALGTTSYLDQYKDAQTGESLPSVGWDAPPDDLSGLTVMAGTFLAGFEGNTVWFSEPNYPHAWPVKYGHTMEAPVVAIGASENSLIVTTTKGVRVLTGSHPESMGESDGSVQQPCVSKRSMCHIEQTVVYACPDGLVGYQGGVGTLLTEGYYNEEQWAALNPDTMIATIHDGFFFGWTDTDSIILDLRGGPQALTSTTEWATGLYTDESTDTMYLVQGTTLRSWKTGADYLTIRWKSKLLQYSTPWSPLVLRVNAESYSEPVIFRFLANQTVVQSLTMTTDVARLIPVMRREKEWEFQIEATTDIHEALFGSSMDDVKIGTR